MQISKKERTNSITLSPDDKIIQRLRANLIAQGIRVVFVNTPIIDDEGATVAMKSFKWDDSAPKSVADFMFPERIDPQSFEVVNLLDGYIDQGVAGIEQKIVAAAPETFYFYYLGAQLVLDAETSAMKIGWIFRGKFD